MTALNERKSRKQFRHGPVSPDEDPTDFLPAHYQHRTVRSLPPTPFSGRAIRTAPISPDVADETVIQQRRIVAPWKLQPPPNSQGRAKRTPLSGLVFVVHYWADSLRLFLTGAASDGGAQTAQASSLGNFRSSTEADRVGRIYSRPLKHISIVQASRANGERGDVGTLFASDANHVRYAAPGSTVPGVPVLIANGETKVVYDASSPSKFLRITRTSATDLAGFGTVEFVDQFNNVYGLSNSANAESVAGGDRYRAVMISNVATIDVVSIKLYLGTLGTAKVSSAGQLGAAGAGTITFAANALVDWPWQGWARIVDSGGTLREIVYYSSRTATALTVPSLGRGRLGTSAGAGAATDTVYPVPGIRIGFEAAVPAVAGAVQTIANESSAPSGITWSTSITNATGVNVGTLTANQQGALWVHRELPAGVSAFAEHHNEIVLDFSVEGQAYSETLAGMFRVAVTASERYELYYASGSAPEIDGSPDETFTSLPYETTGTFANATWFFVTQKRNRYGVATENLEFTKLVVSGGVTVTNPPSAPEVISFEAGASGVGTVKAVYYYGQDTAAQEADTWLIYVTSDGSTPTPGVTTLVTQAMVKTGGVAHLEYSTAQFSTGTTLKILLRTRRAADTSDSSSTDVSTATADATVPGAASGMAGWRDVAEQDQ